MTRGSYCSDIVRQLDSDRYVTALFAPDDRRVDLMALYACNAEVARIRETVSEPMLGQIRLQWWRQAIFECYDGRPPPHSIVSPLAEAIQRHRLSRELFERLLDAREDDFGDELPQTVDGIGRYARDSSGSLTQLALEVFGVRGEGAQRAGDLAGAAWALIGLMRALPYRARVGQWILPRELIAEPNLADAQTVAFRGSPGLCAAVERISLEAWARLDEARSLAHEVPPSGLPAMLIVPLAELYLNRLARTGYDPFDPRNTAPLRWRAWRLMIRSAGGRF